MTDEEARSIISAELAGIAGDKAVLEAKQRFWHGLSCLPRASGVLSSAPCEYQGSMVVKITFATVSHAAFWRQQQDTSVRSWFTGALPGSLDSQVTLAVVVP